MKISSIKFKETSKLESKKKELKRPIKEEVESLIRDQDNKRRKKSQPLLNNQLPLKPLKKRLLKRRENQEEEDQEKVNNDLFVYEFRFWIFFFEHFIEI